MITRTPKLSLTKVKGKEYSFKYIVKNHSPKPLTSKRKIPQNLPFKFPINHMYCIRDGNNNDN